MPKNPYLPSKDGEKVGWLNNFYVKLPLYSATIGVSPAEEISAKEDAEMFAYAVNTLVDAYKQTSKNFTEFKNILRDGPLGTVVAIPGAPALGAAPTMVTGGIFERTAKLVNRIKNHPGYTTQIGDDLGIIGAENDTPPSGWKPALKIRLDAGRPLIMWSKGESDGIDIYANYGNGFQFLATDTQPDYLDTTELPAGVNTAIWGYKAIYRLGDSQVGQWSDEVKITVTRNV